MAKKPKAEVRPLLEYVLVGGQQVLKYVPDARYPAHLHLFYPGGYLPKKIRKLLNDHIKHASGG